MSGDFELDELRDEMRVRSERAEMRHEDELASLRRQVATLREACRKAVDTADELMRNGAKNNVDAGIWGAAYTFGGIARAALAETEETP